MNKIAIATCLSLAAVAACHPTTGVNAPEVGVCRAEFAPVSLQATARGSIVRIESDIGVGTGFVVKRSADGILIATNYHVVREGQSFSVKFESGTQLANVEVVKIDSEHDLALLRTPNLGENVPVLTLSSQPVLLGERIAAIGYPYVRGEEPSMTFEDGGITSTSVEMEGANYIQTNANINPGSSGSPVIDACGRAIGVVVAVHTETQRTGFVIPIERLRTLVASQQAPRGKPDTEIATRVKALESAVRFRKGPEAAAVFSRGLLRDKAAKAFALELQTSYQTACQRVNIALTEFVRQKKPIKVKGRTITDCNALPPDDRFELIKSLLSEDEQADFVLEEMVLDHKIDEQTAMTYWFGQFTQKLFGENPTFTVDRVTASSKDAAETQIMIGAGAESQFWVFGWVYEWGDWRIDNLQCMRGCAG